MIIRDPWIRALVIVMLAIAGLYLAGVIWQLAVQFSDIILLFFLAWIVAFILEPLVVFLRRHGRLPRSAAVTIAYLGLLLLLTGAVLYLVPPLSRQVAQVVVDLPNYTTWVASQILAVQAALEERGVTVNLAVLLNYDDLTRRVETVAPPILSNAVALAASIGSFFFQLAIVLMLSFYVMLDGHRISSGLLRAVPSLVREDVVFFFASVNRAFAGFLRGMLIQALIYTLGVAAIMWTFGLNLVLLTAVANILLMLIPFFGPILALLLPISIAFYQLFYQHPASFWMVFVLVNVTQQIVLNIVAPRVMSSAVGLHPLLVFVGLLFGARVAGVWGAFFGVPVVAVIAMMVAFYHDMIEQRRRAERVGTLVEPDLPARDVPAPADPVAAVEPVGSALAGQSRGAAPTSVR